jgi:hypothetical protein
MKSLLLLNFVVWGIVAGMVLSGCTTIPKRLEIQCIDAPSNRKDYIQGPIVLDGDNMYFYDAKGRLTKVKSQVCGVK